jgi:hypothetical protein
MSNRADCWGVAHGQPMCGSCYERLHTWGGDPDATCDYHHDVRPVPLPVVLEDAQSALDRRAIDQLLNREMRGRGIQ